MCGNFLRQFYEKQSLKPLYAEWCYDDAIKWKHFPRYWPFVWGIHQSPVKFLHKWKWRGTLKFSLICAWTNGWVNNQDAVDLRCNRAHHDVTVMKSICNYISMFYPFPTLRRWERYLKSWLKGGKDRFIVCQTYIKWLVITWRCTEPVTKHDVTFPANNAARQVLIFLAGNSNNSRHASYDKCGDLLIHISVISLQLFSATRINSYKWCTTPGL